MKQIFTVCIILYLLQSVKINVNAENEGVNEADESEETTVKTNNAVATLIGVKNGRKDPEILAVEDKNSSTGYAVQYGPYFPIYYRPLFWVYMYTRTKDQPHFRGFVYGTSLCGIFSNDTSVTSLFPDALFLPRQIIRMVFTGLNNSCKAEGGTSEEPFSSPMISTADVNADNHDTNYRTVVIPQTFPFLLMVNIIGGQDFGHEDTSYIIQVNFTVDLKDSAKKSQGESQGGSSYNCLGTQFNYWILWRICRAYEFVGSIFGLTK